MMLEIDDDWLRSVLNVRSRKKDLGEALEEYLYGDPRFDVGGRQFGDEGPWDRTRRGG
mgnify:CR=1 FL=1